MRTSAVFDLTSGGKREGKTGVSVFGKYGNGGKVSRSEKYNFQRTIYLTLSNRKPPHWRNAANRNSIQAPQRHPPYNPIDSQLSSSGGKRKPERGWKRRREGKRGSCRVNAQFRVIQLCLRVGAGCEEME